MEINRATPKQSIGGMFWFLISPKFSFVIVKDSYIFLCKNSI